MDWSRSAAQIRPVMRPKAGSATMRLSRPAGQPVSTRSMNTPGRADITPTIENVFGAASVSAIFAGENELF